MCVTHTHIYICAVICNLNCLATCHCQGKPLHWIHLYPIRCKAQQTLLQYEMPTFGQNNLRSHALQNWVSTTFKKWCTLIVGRCCKSKWIRYCYCRDCHLIRGGFIHKQSSLFPYVFLVFVGVPGLPHSLSSIHFILHPGFSFQNRLTMCDSNTVDNFKDARESSPIQRDKTSKSKASECFN